MFRYTTPYEYRNSENIDNYDLLSMFINDFSDNQHLSYDQEIYLTIKMEAGKKASNHILSGRYTKEEKAKLEQIIKEGQAARSQLINSNYKLVISISKRYRNRGMALIDLVQEGYIGLIRAVDKFDYRKECRLSTHASWWIKNSVSRAVESKGHIIPASTYLVYKIRKMFKARREFLLKNNREPNTAELAEEMDTTVKQISIIESALKNPISLDTSFSDNNRDENYVESVPDVTSPPVEDAVLQKIMCEALINAIDSLPEREMNVIKLHYGFNGEAQSLMDIGKKMGISKEAVRKIEAKAVSKIKSKIM